MSRVWSTVLSELGSIIPTNIDDIVMIDPNIPTNIGDIVMMKKRFKKQQQETTES